MPHHQDQDQAAASVRAQVDQLAAAARDGDQASADEVIAALIADDHPGARAVFADALRLHAARAEIRADAEQDQAHAEAPAERHEHR
jgi:hypothetical protein